MKHDDTGVLKRGGWFVTGTDTGVGKTSVALALLTALERKGRKAVGMKPIASGCRKTAAGLRCDDAERLQAASSVTAEYVDINPYAFADPVAPHLAATAEGIVIRIEKIQTHFDRLQRLAPWVVVEGAGGWRVPLNDAHTMADLAKVLNLPVVLVVGIRLGCLNHALLTAAAIQADGVRLAGWVANQIESGLALFEENVATLRVRFDAPLLGVFPYQKSGFNPTHASHLILEKLI